MNVETREMVDLAMEMRRHVRREFKVDLKLSQPDLLDQLVHFAGNSCNDDLRGLAAQLLALVPLQAANDMPSANEPSYHYRGIPIAPGAAQSPPSTEEVRTGRPRGLIYRGRPVR